jgi:adenine C2-methylase RlmN of 23S rRNA A2503 and tRNA A37
MASYKQGIRRDLPKLYSQDLLNNLFRHPYTKIEFVEEELGVTRKTASQYLRQLVERDYLRLALPEKVCLTVRSGCAAGCEARLCLAVQLRFEKGYAPGSGSAPMFT